MENALVALSDELAATVERASRYVVSVHGRPRISSSGVWWKKGVVVTAEHTLRRPGPAGGPRHKRSPVAIGARVERIF